MRLSPAQAEVILRCVRQQYGADAIVMLFGSRLDDAARGGDVDLLVDTAGPPTLRQRALATLALEQALLLPVDILARQRGTPGCAFARSVRGKARPLEPELVNAARRLLQLCTQSLVVGPATADFDAQSPVFAMTSTHDFDFESFDRP